MRDLEGGGRDQGWADGGQTGRGAAGVVGKERSQPWGTGKEMEWRGNDRGCGRTYTQHWAAHNTGFHIGDAATKF